MLVKLVHLGKPTSDIPFLWNLSVDMHEAVENLLKLQNLAYLDGMFATRRNPRASKMHYALASVEDAILKDVEQEVLNIPSASINTLLFDGALVLVNEVDVDELKRRMALVGDRWRVSFSVDVW